MNFSLWSWPSLSSPLQVCRTDHQQQNPCPGVAGAEGVHRHTHHQHREERHGVSVTARPQTSPCPSVGFPPVYSSPLMYFKISCVFSVVEDTSGVSANICHFQIHQLIQSLNSVGHRELTGKSAMFIKFLNWFCKWIVLNHWNNNEHLE